MCRQLMQSQPGCRTGKDRGQKPVKLLILGIAGLVAGRYRTKVDVELNLFKVGLQWN